LESLVYVISEWNLRGSEVFGKNNLQALSLILLALATVIAFLAWLGMLANVLLARDRDQKNW
jgi:hypothetical protein